MRRPTRNELEVLVHNLLDALKFSKSVLEANPVELSERMAIQKAAIAIGEAAALRPVRAAKGRKHA